MAFTIKNLASTIEQIKFCRDKLLKATETHKTYTSVEQLIIAYHQLIYLTHVHRSLVPQKNYLKFLLQHHTKIKREVDCARLHLFLPKPCVLLYT